MSAARENIRALGNQKNTNTMTFVHVGGTDSDVLVTSTGIRHGILGKGPNSMATADVEMRLGDVLANAVEVNKMKNGQQHILVGYAQRGESGYVVRFVVDETDDAYELNGIHVDEIMHSAKSKKTGAAAIQGRGSGLAGSSSENDRTPTISIEELLNAVKNSYPDILSENALKQFGMSEGTLPQQGGSLKDYTKYSVAEDEAKADGASDLKATAYATVNGLLNALVEVGGGGIQELPSALRKGSKAAVREWVDTMIDEGKEEVVQGIMERLLQNVTYGKGNKLASVSDQNAILNPVTSVKEFGGGALVGGILGAGQLALTPNVQSGPRYLPRGGGFEHTKKHFRNYQDRGNRQGGRNYRWFGSA